VLRVYTPADLEATIALFGRSVREIAIRDYSPSQVRAWAPERPDAAAWARRLATGGVFVDERNGEMAGFGRIDDTGCVDLLSSAWAFAW
jgi:putative acetyltransferase